MQDGLKRVLLGIQLTALYFLGGALAVLFLRTPTDVALFWPAAGVGLAAVLRFGLGYVVIVPVATLLMHLFVVPVPVEFMAWSIASNTVATLLAGSYVRRQGIGLQLRTADGFILLRAGLLLSLVSAALGCLGMLHAGMTTLPSLGRVFLQWALGDLLGVTSVGPLMLFLTAPGRARSAAHLSRTPEVAYWSGLLVLAMALVFGIGKIGTQNPLALASIPLGLLLWSAMRLPPLVTLVSTSVVIICVSLMTGLGLGGFERPATLHDSVLVMAMLVLYSIIPVLLMASRLEHARAAADLFQRATRDTLTGLLNRDTFEEHSRLALSGSDQSHTLIYVDLDNFKLMNDSASHAAGDEMIRLVAGMVTQEFGDTALVARTGGDEFAILAPMDDAAAGTRARRLLASIDQARIAWQGQVLGTTASIGLAMSPRPPHAPFDELLSQADAACFTAKDLGGNRTFVATTNPDDIKKRVRSMHSAVAAREALDQRRFVLFCQPIINLRKQALLQSHFEVLVQWRDTEGRLRPPSEIIAAAERYRIGPRLDRHVLDATLAWLEAHPDDAAQVEHCAINIGGTTLVDDDFCDYVAARLRRSPLRAEQICFEITETSVVRDMTRARRFIGRLRELGCRFALDDFGTGFCSFGYLRDLDVDYLKIDGSFVRELDAAGGLPESVVRAITEIAHRLGKLAVAEQAETVAQLGLLRELGVDYAQGYVFQRPQPIAAFFARESA